MKNELASTVPNVYVRRMLEGAKKYLQPAELRLLLRAAGIEPNLLKQRSARITRAQFGKLYAAIAIRTGDEMLGCWSRPIRTGALKYLGLSVLSAPTLLVALYRFTRFWNLLLDDYRLELSREADLVSVTLRPRTASTHVSVFGHELMVKLVHGLLAWLAGKPLTMRSVSFAFSRPEAFEEYAHLFPVEIAFRDDLTAVRFAAAALRERFSRSKGELIQFVRGAPNQWLFQSLDPTSLPMRVRTLVGGNLQRNPHLSSVSKALGLSTRTLARRLAEERTSFRAIKDDARRDQAIDLLVNTREPIGKVAMAIGMANVTAFHRRFRAWTGSTPKTYRRQGSP